MTDKPKKPLLSFAAQAEAAVREARRAAALRSNLRRRKTQDQTPETPAAEPASAEPAPAEPVKRKRPSLFASEMDAAVRDARREASLRGAPRRRKD